MENKTRLSSLVLFIFALAIAIPALFINLGEQSLIDDEAIRALVAFEMLDKGDLINPTIAGEPYLKKPPLYNWLIMLSFKTFGSYDEFAVRMPMIISLLMFTLAIFYYFRKEMNTRFAVISALMFLTSGRILTYESLHGLIDITYSLLIFVFIMQVYRSFVNGKLLQLYLIGYFLIALSFLMKGLPSIAFLGITLLVLFISHKKFRLLFHWGHYLGILLFLVIVGGYYLLYFSRNAITPMEMLDVILGESSRRTIVKFGFWNTVLHIIKYPFEVLYHFLPWGLMVLLFLKKGSFTRVKAHPFMRYISLVFLANIVIYWTSPEVFPRYILMLVPLLFGVFVYLYLEQYKDRSLMVKVIEITFGVIILAGALGVFMPLFIELSIPNSNIYLALSILVPGLFLVIFMYLKNTDNRLIWFAIALLFLRIGFNLIVIPERVANSNEIEGKKLAQEIVQSTKGEQLNFWWNPQVIADSYYGYRVTSYRFNYYIFYYRNEVIKVSLEKDYDQLYISKMGFLYEEKIEILKKFKPPGHESDLVLFRFLEE